MPGVIDKPGLYPDLSSADYHADPCVEPSISSSGLRTIAMQSAKHYWQDSPLNPRRKPVRKECWEFGKAAHMLVLEGEKKFKELCFFKPEGFEARSKDNKAMLAEWQGQYEAVLPSAAREPIYAMAREIEHHELAMLAFSNGIPEPTIIWQDPEFGIWLRAKPDFLPHVPTLVPDYKTGRSAGATKWRSSVKDYGYHMQAAHVLDGVRALGLGDGKQFLFFVQETTPPYIVACRPLPKESEEWGRVQNWKAKETFARCLDRGLTIDNWDGYPDDGEEIGLPHWAIMDLQRQNDIGAFEPHKETK